MDVEVNDEFGGQSGPCPGCGQPLNVPAASPEPTSMSGVGAAAMPYGSGRPGVGAGPAKTSGWAIASLVCGLFGCLLLPAIPGIIFGILGIRQVNRSEGRVTGLGLAIAGLVISVLMVLGIGIMGGFQALMIHSQSSPLEQARRAQCAANLRGIGQSIKVYSAGNRGKWPTVYSGRPGEAWRQDWTEGDSEIADAQEGVDEADLDPFTCNLSCWWVLIRQGMSHPNVFVCPTADQYPDESTTDYSSFWSFQDLQHVSYSYQNQLGRGTTDNADAELIVAADASPLRGDLAGEPSTRGEDRAKVNRWELNSPNHDFEGQNCLYADGHVSWNNTPDCGIGGNNIWLRSVRDTATDTWTDDDASYDDPQSTVGDKRDTFLVP
jgi:prepilin-type processing-associated H-X9-DG protein